MCVLLLLKAATVAPREYRRCKGSCDNEGVIFHCNKLDERVKMNQSSDDIVRICKELLRGLPMKVYFGCVRGHADQHTLFEHLTLAQQLNVIADKLAQEALVSSLINERHIDSSSPFETIQVFDRSTKEKSISEISENLARWRSEMVARTYYATKKEGARTSCEKIKLVHWEGMRRYLKNKLRRYRNWLTKQANRACGCHGHLTKWLRKERNRKIKDECPSCGKP